MSTTTIIIKKTLVLAFVAPLMSSPVDAVNVTGHKVSLPITQNVLGMMIAEHDIFVAREDAGNAITARGLGMTSQFSTWTNGQVPYQFKAGISAYSKETVLKAISHWNENSSITLYDHTVAGSTPSADYIEFTSGPGCASWVGRQGNEQEVWVADACTTGSMIHEIGHALGLLHEHTRSDRDQYLEVKWENIQSTKGFNFELGGSGTTDLGEYDYGSIMHYGEYFFSANGAATLTPNSAAGDVRIGQRVAASAGDLAAIDSLYGSDLSLNTEISASPDGTDATFTVSNLHSMGAHGITVSMDITDGVLGFSGDTGWNCAEAEAQIQCHLNVLPGDAVNSVTVSFDDAVTVETLAAVVTSKTHDINPGNNNGLALGAANGQSDDARSARSASTNANLAGGGGSFDLIVLMMLLITVALRVASTTHHRRLLCTTLLASKSRNIMPQPSPKTTTHQPCSDRLNSITDQSNFTI